MFNVHVGLPVKCQLSCALTLAKISKCRQIRFQEIHHLRCYLWADGWARDEAIGSISKHLFNSTDWMHNVYSLHLLHFSNMFWCHVQHHWRELLCLLIIKTNKMHFFSSLFWYRTLHVLDRFTVYHQESSTVYTAIGIYHTGYADCLLAGSGRNILIPLESSQYKLYDIYLWLCIKY